MIDLIKTFLLGLWKDKKSRYFCFFVIVASAYRFSKWLIVLLAYELSPVSFKGINDDGALVFVFVNKYEQVIYPKDLYLPTKYGKKSRSFKLTASNINNECEKKFFKFYTSAVMNLINSSANQKFIIQFEKKFPKKIGEITYVDTNKKVVNIYETLERQGFVFSNDQDINYCKELSILENK